MTDQDQKRKLSNLRSMLTRRAKRKMTPAAYECVGGPFSGSEIYLETSSTGDIRIRGSVDRGWVWAGRYITITDADYYHQSRHQVRRVVWEEAA